MRKIWPYFIVITLLIGMFVIIIKNNEKLVTKIITIETLHSYLYDYDQLIEIPIYVTGNIDVFADQDAYDSFYIYNDDKKLFVNLKEVKISHHEQYLKELYTKIVLKFEFPNLSEAFNIENAYLNVTMANQDEYNLKIGNVALSYVNNTADFDWQVLDSKKDPNKNTTVQMDYITIKFNGLIPEITSIHIDNFNTLNYEIVNNELLIEIPNYKLLINYVPLWVNFKDGSTKTFNNYHYIIEYNALEKAQRIMNIYVIN